MGSKVFQNQIKTLTGLFLLMVVICDNFFAQNHEPHDSLVCVIYFSDGFDNDTLQLKIGEMVAFDKIFLKSNLYYGLSGIEVWITNDYEVFLIESKEGYKKV